MPAHRPDDRVEPHGVALHVDAREARGFAVAADRDGAAAEGGAVEQHPAERGDDREDPDQDVDADDVGVHELDEAAVADRQGAAFGEDLGEAAGGDEHGEGRHERDDLAVGDDDAVDEPGGEADGEGDDDHHDPVASGRRGPGSTAMVATTEARPITEPTDRSMPPAMMTSVMPMLIDADDRRLAKDREDVADAGEGVGGGDGAHDDEQQQRDDEAEVAADGAGHEPLEPGLLRRGCRGRAVRRAAGGCSAAPAVVWLAHAAVPFMTRSSTPCSSIWEAGRVWSTRPSEMTRTVSARPSTSSISLETMTMALPAAARRRIRA